jgi:ubiquinone/menaquinone biosynthesis C-methylase UbiE
MKGNLGVGKTNHLAKLSDFSAPFYDLIFKHIFWQGREKDFRQSVIELMNSSGDESILDVGCGTGTLSSLIAQRMNGRGSVFGVDISLRMIEVAQRKARKQGTQVEYKIATSLALPFDNETFDVAVTSLVYHQLLSLKEKVKTLTEIRRVLKPEGRYIAAEFAKFILGNLWVIHDSLIKRLSLFRPDLLERNGFHIVEKMGTSKGIMVISAGGKWC